jgi:hypothetical protein
MAFRSWAAVLLHVLVVTLPSTARADPIRVTDGALVGDRFLVTLTATGERGLSISAFGDAFGGSYGPSHCNRCLPGDQLNIASSWSGSDFPGFVSLDGQTFRVGSIDLTLGSLFTRFDGDKVLMPEFAGETRVSLTRPFSFEGLFFYPESEIPRPRVELTGSGTATLQFDWSVSDKSWGFRGAEYEFAPVPEPTSIVLVGIGLTGLGVRHWRQRMT